MLRGQVAWNDLIHDLSVNLADPKVLEDFPVGSRKGGLLKLMGLKPLAGP